MLTIGQLARRTGVPAKTVRFYHSVGLLPEPARDSSGYRRYTAADAIALLKVRSLAEAGVPLTKIPALLRAQPHERAAAIELIDRDLQERVARLQETRRRLRNLTAPEPNLPPGVAEYLDVLTGIGMSDRWVDMERDLWLLAFATHPASAAQLLADQHEAKTHPAVQQVYRDYDRARDLDPGDRPPQGPRGTRSCDAPPGVSDQTIRLALKALKDTGDVETDSVGRGATWTRRT